MLGRTGTFTGRCRFELKQCRSLSSPVLPRLHYPAGSGSRRDRTGQEAGQMSLAQINSILKANEHSHTPPRGPASHGVLGFHSNMLPSNQPSEDRRSSATYLPGRGGMLFGVFDGHAGGGCAHSVSQRLFYYIAVATLPLGTLVELDQCVEEQLLEWHQHPQDPSSPQGGAACSHSLRLYWQDRLRGRGQGQDQGQGQGQDEGQDRRQDQDQGRIQDQGQGQGRLQGQGQGRLQGQGQDEGQDRRQDRDRRQDQGRIQDQGQGQDRDRIQDQGRDQLQDQNQEEDRLQDQGQNQEDGTVTSALVNAFRRLDWDLSLEAQVHLSTSSPRRLPVPGDMSQSSPLRVALSGCTACVAHISNGILHVANLGDSRAVLGVQGPDGQWSAVSLTNDHNAQNPDELQRILGEHPPSERRTVVRHERLLGLLLPFRAFGDVRFKWSREMLSRVHEVSEGVRTPSPHYLTPPYLSAQPEVIRHHITPSDKFLVLATDGLWELMHRQTVVQLVGELLTGLQQQRPLVPSRGMTLGGLQRLLLERRGQVMSVLEDQNAATHLLRHALGDDGYGAVAPNRLAKMLSLPSELARRYRDDITITVILLNESDL